ncbi:hypothetical protein [Ramlibacter tataouinensis]|uniref:Candidate membrane protein n=1 Tax=Ramlibacter tataouinensis (strain ATCC BAA-407 / DSM 14655 / LMG 21543 / TTB310) TaxID=365046 RepID=F5XXS2_RAMTT|nr:hypothetical protein [Ramlibacter tataouinensis]AEG93057.1 candidate membrane protein [Ramlibacter tataouinensis TTB310]
MTSEVMAGCRTGGILRAMRPSGSLVVSCLLAVVGIIHLLPLPGVLGPERLRLLYGIPLDDPNLVLLMRHRAVLFGLLGALLLYAAWRPSLVPLALMAGWASVAAFLVLAALQPGLNAALARVVTADVLAAFCLAVATALWAWQRHGWAARTPG